MKNLKLALCFLAGMMAATLCFAQGSDPYIKVTYLGYSGGKYHISVVNKQTCAADIALLYYGFIPTSMFPDPKNNVLFNQIAGGDTALIDIQGTYNKNFQIAVAALTVCQWKGVPPVFVFATIASALPIKMSDIQAKRLGDDQVELTFTVQEQSNVKQLNVQLSKDGVNYNTVQVILPDKITLNVPYKTVVTIP